MREREVALPGLSGDGLLREPDSGSVRGGVVALHGAADPSRRQPLFDHLAATLTQVGYAVLTFDRRDPGPDGGDVPLDVQATDARVALTVLEKLVGAPVGLFAFSQGAWAACLAAAAPDRPDVAHLALVGCSGVSPAEQMRYFTDELLRRAGYDEVARGLLRELRLAMEDVLRGRGDRDRAAALLAHAVGQPWFEHAYLPTELPPADLRWDDLDHDPRAAVAEVRCPTLLLHGEDEECVPVAPSVAIWEVAPADVSAHLLPGCGHYPSVGSGARPGVAGAPSSDYTALLRGWYDALA
ncbi:alpha/beta hydrolase [Nocardioides rubriscoriae]|uniref:alpha/beta hydrolase n=1 Tax=Nocardioides rubriscoriae TaxID=642762 RepID=UPI0011E03F95|nr:alpha/beta hydrolase [Nocardioides rubriscoriae]